MTLQDTLDQLRDAVNDLRQMPNTEIMWDRLYNAFMQVMAIRYVTKENVKSKH